MAGFIGGGLKHETYEYSFSVDGGAAAAVTLSNKANKHAVPVGAVVLQVSAVVLTACTSGGSATVEWGNGDDADGYSGTAVAVASLVAGYVHTSDFGAAALLWDNTNDAQKGLYIDDAATGAFKLISNVAALTAGKIAFIVTYFVPES